MAVRPKRVDSLLGSLHIERHYYHCRACGSGSFPRDRRLGLGAAHLTPAVSEVACIAGVQTSFAQSAEITLDKMCGLKLSESTVERVTEWTGERLAQLLAEKITFGAEQHWQWQRDARGQRCAYVGLDAISIRQQGPGATQAEGRMAYVATFYNPRSDFDPQRPKPHQTRFLAGFYGLDELGVQARRQAAQIGWDGAEQQIALSDGGNGLEAFFRKNFPLAECIIDFWHAAEHLKELALVLYADDDAQRLERTEAWCHRLKAEGGWSIVRMLQQLDLTDRSSATRSAHAECLGYFQNHQHRMDYPRYVANGWQIGSGPVESACKAVVANRLKGSGMRWGLAGSDAVCHLRALYLSEPSQWEAFWRDYPN